MGPDDARPVRRPRPSEGRLIAALALASALSAGLAGATPAQTFLVDPLLAAAFGAAVVLMAARADRLSVLWLTGLSIGFSRHWLVLPAALGLLAALGGTTSRRRFPLVNSLAAAFAIQVVLRWPHFGPTGTTALLATAAVIPVAVSAFWFSRHRRAVLWWLGAAVLVAVVMAVPFLVSALISRSQIDSGYSAVKAALSEMGRGETAIAQIQLASADERFRTASDALNGWWTGPARALPLLSQQQQTAATASRIAERLAALALHDAQDINFSDIRYANGGLDLARVESLEPPLRTMSQVLGQSQAELSRIQTRWLFGPVLSGLRRLQNEVAKVKGTASLAQLTALRAPDLLGATGTRHYLVAFMDPPESRGLGGLLVWYAELDATNGHLSISKSGDTLNLVADLASRGGGRITGPPSYLSRYGQFAPQKFLPDVSYAPDLPTDSEVLSELWSQLGRGPIDGVLILDPKSVASLVSLTGPVEVPGLGSLTGTTTAGILEKKQYVDYPAPDQQAQRKATLSSALKTASDRLVHGALPSPRQIINTLGPDVKTGDLLFWSSHPEDQGLLERTGLSGQFPKAEGGDLLSVVSMNAVNNKIDAYLQRTIDDRVSFDPATGSVRSTVAVSFTNNAPSSGLPDEVIGSYSGSGYPLGTERLWFTFYSPLGLVSAQVGTRAVGLEVDREFGVNTYSGYVTVPAGATVTVTAVLAGHTAPGSYRLVLHQQPTVVPDRVRIRVTADGGGRGTSTWTPPAAADDFRAFRFPPTRN